MNDSRSGSTHTTADLIYDAIFIAGLGGGLVAMFFLVFDMVTLGQPLFTPSLIGSVLFDGASPQSVHTVNMMAVAKYTAVHFVAFGVAGVGLSLVTHFAELRARHPALVIAFAFVALEAGFWLGTAMALPGVLERIGVLPVAAANLLAAVGVGLFLVTSHRPEHLLRARRVTHPG
jgi:hypothetical protein